MDNQQPGSQDPNTIPANPSPAPMPTPAPVEPAPQAVPVQPVAPQTFAPQSEPTSTFQPTAQPVTQPYNPQPTGAQQPQGGHDPGHGMGIASLVTSLLGLGLVGVILGFLAISKSKKAGLKGNTLGLIGVILGFMNILAGILIMVLLLAGWGAAKEGVKDIVAINNTNSLHAKLEEYYNNNNSYPKTVSVAILPGIDEAALQDANGSAIVVDEGKSLSELEAETVARGSTGYVYIPFGCSADACKGYILRVNIQSPTASTPDPYVKYGLYNP